MLAYGRPIAMNSIRLLPARLTNPAPMLDPPPSAQPTPIPIRSPLGAPRPYPHLFALPPQAHSRTCRRTPGPSCPQRAAQHVRRPPALRASFPGPLR